MKDTMLIIMLIISILIARPVIAIEVYEMHELLGFTMIAYSNVSGTFEGADFGKIVKFDNGMLFEFNDFYYTYSFRPAVAVFARTYTVEEMKKMKLKTFPQNPLTLYKLIIGNHIYNAMKIR